MACALDIFTGLKAEVEPQLDQVSNMPGLRVVGGDSCCHDGLNDAQGGGLFPLDWGILNPISFELAGNLLVQSNVSLGVMGGSGVV